MQEAVRGEEARAGRRRPAGEGRAAAAGLLDEQLDRRVVPELQHRVGGDVERRPRRRGSAARSRRSPRFDHARSASRAPAGRHVGAPTSSRRRVLEPRDGGDAAAARRSRTRPSPRTAHQRRPSAGAETSRDVDLALALEREQRRPDGDAAHVVRVPSIGSTIQRTSPPSSPSSSPSTPSPRPDAATSARIASSAARSASDTGVRSGFVSTCRSSARKRASVIASAASARSCAKREIGAHRRRRQRRRFEREPGGEHERVVARGARPPGSRPAGRPRLPARQREGRPAERVEREREERQRRRGPRARRRRRAARRQLSVGVSRRSWPSSAANARSACSARARTAAAYSPSPTARQRSIFARMFSP